MTAKQMLQLQQEDIIKAARCNVFTNSLLNQQKVIKALGYTINLLGATLPHTNPDIMHSGRVLEVLEPRIEKCCTL